MTHPTRPPIPVPTRRRLLGGLAALAVAVTALPVTAEASAAPDARLARSLVWTMANPATIPVEARAVGVAYLRAAPAEADVAGLVAALAPPDGARADVAALRAHLRGLRRRDLAAGDTVRLGGRTIPRTQARLCALAVLL